MLDLNTIVIISIAIAFIYGAILFYLSRKDKGLIWYFNNSKFIEFFLVLFLLIYEVYLINWFNQLLIIIPFQIIILLIWATAIKFRQRLKANAYKKITVIPTINLQKLNLKFYEVSGIIDQRFDFKDIIATLAFLRSQSQSYSLDSFEKQMLDFYQSKKISKIIHETSTSNKKNTKNIHLLINSFYSDLIK